MNTAHRAEVLIQLIAEAMHRSIYQGALELSRGEGGILMYLCFVHDGATSGELSEQLAVGSGRIANALKVLEGKGMIVRRRAERDRRRVIVNLTDEGRRFACGRRLELGQKTERLLSEMGEPDASDFLRLLERAVLLAKRLERSDWE